jgi:hypothetical protein
VLQSFDLVLGRFVVRMALVFKILGELSPESIFCPKILFTGPSLDPGNLLFFDEIDENLERPMKKNIVGFLVSARQSLNLDDVEG